MPALPVPDTGKVSSFSVVEQPAQHGFALFHDLEEFRVQMADNGG